MKYLLNDINFEAKTNPRAFIERCESKYQEGIVSVVDDLVENSKEKPIILVNGPSSSGKTTTASRMKAQFAKHGINAEILSMDDYYRSRDIYKIPIDEFGLLDLESPLCMDLSLLGDHLHKLAEGQTIYAPHFDFQAQKSELNVNEIQLEDGEVAIIEGIHAFSNIITDKLGDKSNGVYLSVDSQVQVNENEILMPEMLRFMRRAVRDSNFRNSPVHETITQWRSVRRGEELYINPNLKAANYTIDTYIAYETCILMNELQERIKNSYNELDSVKLANVHKAIGKFSEIDFEQYMPKNSLIHEFIG